MHEIRNYAWSDALIKLAGLFGVSIRVYVAGKPLRSTGWLEARPLIAGAVVRDNAYQR
jgi:hypothetical protein